MTTYFEMADDFMELLPTDRPYSPIEVFADLSYKKKTGASIDASGLAEVWGWEPLEAATAISSFYAIVGKDSIDARKTASSVIAYLNKRAGRNFKITNHAVTLIKSRIREGYKFEQFKSVIDKKVAEWENDPKFSRYIRPDTLFGTKFDSYLNEPAHLKLVSNNADSRPALKNFSLDDK